MLMGSRVQRRGWSQMTTSATSDFGRVLAAAADGDTWAFATLYERFAPRIKAFAMTRSVEDADAVANDVMLRIFQNIATFEGDEASFVSWTFTIARNRIIDLHRASARRPARSDDDRVPERLVASAEEDALGRMSIDEANALLAHLTEEQREVIALRMIADLSLEQVAAVVAKPVTAVKALQRRGMRRLQRIILDGEVSR